MKKLASRSRCPWQRLQVNQVTHTYRCSPADILGTTLPCKRRKGDVSLGVTMFVRCPHLGPCLSASIWVRVCQVPPSVQCLSASIWVHGCQPPSGSMSDASICVSVCQPPSGSMVVSLYLGPCLSDASIYVSVCQSPSGSMVVSLHLGPCLSDASICVNVCQPPSGSMFVRCLHLCQCLSASIWVHGCQVPLLHVLSLHLGPSLSDAVGPCC